MKILLLEDNPAIRRAYTAITESVGHEVESYENAKQALASDGLNNIDLFFVDIMLPGMDGVSFIEELRSRDVKSPVVVTTNMGSGYDKFRLESCGVKEIILKVQAGPKEIREILKKYS